MIIASLRLDDETSLHYQNEAVERGIDNLNEVLADRLKRAVGLDPRHRYIILADRTLERAEKALGGLPIQSAEDLVTKARRLATIRFGEHELTLTPGQMEEIKWRAMKQGKSVEDLLAETWRVFCQDFFTLVVPAAPMAAASKQPAPQAK